MPENKYQRGKIYKIISNNTENVYVGSTCEPYLCNRLYGHKSCYKHWLKEQKNYVSSFELVKFDDAVIVLLESYPCNSKDELRAREQYWIESIPNCINNRVAYQFPAPVDEQEKKEYACKRAKKWYVEHQDKAQERGKNYYNENKATILKKQQVYYEKNIDKIKKYHKSYEKTEAGKEVTKRTLAKHREKRLQEKRDRYAKLRTKFREKALCSVCNYSVCQDRMRKHVKTTTHINNLGKDMQNYLKFMREHQQEQRKKMQTNRQYLKRLL